MLFRKTRKTLQHLLVTISVTGILLILWTFYSQNHSSIQTRLDLIETEKTAPSSASPSVSSEMSAKRNYHFVLFLIPTTPDSVEHRQLLRSTWMNISAWPEEEFRDVDPKFLNFKTMFVVGRVKGKEYSAQFLAEASQHDDIFIVDYLFEELGVLKYKVLWGMFRSLLLFDYSFLVKVDMDTLVILPDMIKGLSELPAHMVYSGTCYAVLPKFHTDKFKPELTLNYRNHRYCFGGGYFLSRDLIQHLSELDSSLYVTVVDAEDWYIGWLVYHVRRKLGINTKEVQLEKDDHGYMKNEGYSKYNFDGTWFLHFLRTPAKLIDAFTCRKNMVIEACPHKVYMHTSNYNGTCTCFNKNR